MSTNAGLKTIIVSVQQLDMIRGTRKGWRSLRPSSFFRTCGMTKQQLLGAPFTYHLLTRPNVMYRPRRFAPTFYTGSYPRDLPRNRGIAGVEKFD